MAGPTALIFGTKKSLASSLSRNLQKFLSGQRVGVSVGENPKDIAGKGPFAYAILVCEEKVPPPTINAWFKVFSEETRPSDRLFVLSPNELPSAWQENLPIESCLEESNYQAILQEIIDPGTHSQKEQNSAIESLNGPVGSLNMDVSNEGGMFDLDIASQPLSAESASEESAESGSGPFFASASLSLGSQGVNAAVVPPPPSAKAVASTKKPPPPTSLKIANAKSAIPSTEANTRMAPLSGKKSLPAKPVIQAEAEFTLDADPEVDGPSMQFDLSEDTSAVDNKVIDDGGLQEDVSAIAKAEPSEASGTDLGLEVAESNDATRVSKPLQADVELPPAKGNLKLSMGKPAEIHSEETDSGSPGPQTGSIRFEELQHPDGTQLNEPLAGRGEDVNMDDLAAEEAKGGETSFEISVDEPSAEDPSPEASDQSFEMPSEDEAPMSSGVSSSEVKTLEKYLAIKDRELRERESNIKILKGQLQKTEAKLLKSDEARRSQSLKLDEVQAEIGALREDLEQKNFALQKVEDHHREEMKALQARMDGALFEANKAGKRLDEFRERVKQDIQKIRAQERELANKLEIQKRDADALLGAKDEKLMAQRREIDQLQFELDNLKERLVEETEKAEERSKRLSRALASLKLAQGMLSGIKEEVVPTADEDDDSEGEAA